MHQNLLVSSVVYFQKRKLNFVMNWTQIIKKLKKLLREKNQRNLFLDEARANKLKQIERV